MRTTLTLDDDLAALLRQQAATRGISFKETVNQALRAGLARETTLRAIQTPRTIRHSFGFRPGVDLDRLNQFADDLEAAAVVESLTRTR